MNKVFNKIKDKESRLVLSNIIMSLFLKGASLILSLACTREYIVYFDNNVILGGWFAVVSILNWILYFDLGIGNGLRNGIVIPIENKDYCTVKKYISTGYISVGIISIVITFVGIGGAYLINWNKALNLPIKMIDNMSLFIMIFVVIVGTGTQFALKVIVSIYQAMRKTALFGWTTLMTNGILYIFLKIASIQGVRNQLLVFAFVYIVATNLPLLIVTIVTFLGEFKNARPSIKYYDREIARNILSLGIKFFVIQVALLVISSTDSWLITYFFKPENTVSYQVYFRFFSIALTVYALFSQTAWSSVTKYAGEKNGKAIKNIYIFLNAIAGLGTLACFVLAFLFKYIVNIWMGDVYTRVSLDTAMLFAGWMSIQMVINSSTAVANGLGKLKCQSIFVPIAGVIKILGVIVMSSLGYDWNSVLVCNIVCLIPLAIFQHIDNQRNYKILSK